MAENEPRHKPEDYILMEAWIRAHTRLTPSHRLDAVIRRAQERAAKAGAPLHTFQMNGDIQQTLTRSLGAGMAAAKVMLSAGLWYTKDNEVLRISEMETQHIRYCVAIIFMKANGWRADYIPLLTSELARRGDGNDVRSGISEVEGGGDTLP